MSAILSADDLNDFISPGVACIKPIETLPKQQPENLANPYEVTTEDKLSAQNAPPAQITLADCLACSGCVTSAEAVLVSLQSHSEVLETLDKYRELPLSSIGSEIAADPVDGSADAKIFVASISPQSRASLAATYNVTEGEAGNMIDQLLRGPSGIRTGGAYGSGFAWIIDTNIMRDVCLYSAAEEVRESLGFATHTQKRPILTSACPGWICYAEKTHPHVLPHLSKLKSPQALTGTLIKSVMARKFGIPPEKVWHMAVMPCFDKKLEASRSELTSDAWHEQGGPTVRDVDCVITARELLMLAESRGISFPTLPRRPIPNDFARNFPDAVLNSFLFGPSRRRKRTLEEDAEFSAIGTSGGYLFHVLKSQKAKRPGSRIRITQGRNTDVAEYAVVDANGQAFFNAARYYGFRNIQNLVRKLKPAAASRLPGAARRPVMGRRGGNEASEYSYVEVMACPGGCTNGGGQIKIGDLATLGQIGGTGIVNGSTDQKVLPAQREWLAKVDEAYWSAGSEDSDDDTFDGNGDTRMPDSPDGVESEDFVGGIDGSYIRGVLEHWASTTGVDLGSLLYTSYRVVESDVGKGTQGVGKSDMERVSALAIAQGGGW